MWMLELKGLIVSPGLGIPQSMIKLVCTLYHWLSDNLRTVLLTHETYATHSVETRAF